MRLVITERLGVVHNWLNGHCTTVIAASQSERNGRVAHYRITGMQALVYQLPFCPECFTDYPAYRRIIQGQKV